MPIYEYRCDDCETSIEVLQKMSDDPLEVCDGCGGALRRVLHPVAIHFKGSGFYTTDYGKGSGRGTGARDDGGSTSGDGENSSAAASGDSAPSSGSTPSASSSSRQPSGDGKGKEKQQTT